MGRAAPGGGGPSRGRRRALVVLAAAAAIAEAVWSRRGGERAEGIRLALEGKPKAAEHRRKAGQ